MKFIHVNRRPISRLTIIISSFFIRSCPRYGNLQKHTMKKTVNEICNRKFFQSFNYYELFGSLILIIIEHAKRHTQISMQNVGGVFFKRKKNYKPQLNN